MERSIYIAAMQARANSFILFLTEKKMLLVSLADKTLALP